MSKRVLLINPSYSFLYKNTKIKAGAIYSPLLSLAALAAPLLNEGYQVEILDLNLQRTTDGGLEAKLQTFQPEFVGITFTTPLFEEATRLASIVKALRKNTVLIGGGAHPSSFPEEVLQNSQFDIAVIGEGDFSLLEIVCGNDPASIKGISYKNRAGEIVTNPHREYIKDLDVLPFPAWQLYDFSNYQTTKLLTRDNPAGWLETSRGCPFHCSYCNKNIHGQTFRVKSPKRVVDEIEYMLEVGFREIHIADDGCTTNMHRAKEICDEIIRRRLEFPWATVTGIRVDRVDRELLKKMKEAGCYRVYYGIESGNQKVLDACNKGITLDQVRKAVLYAQEVGLEVFGFFMLALPGETEKTMRDTINFAKELDLDMAKVSITVPLPRTPLFDDLEKNGLIKTYHWSKYNLYFPAREIYDHPCVDWDTTEKYFVRFYREFYLRPSFIAKRFLRSVRRGRLASDIRYFLLTDW